jgi:hypothetical protein
MSIVTILNEAPRAQQEISHIPSKKTGIETLTKQPSPHLKNKDLPYKTCERHMNSLKYIFLKYYFLYSRVYLCIFHHDQIQCIAVQFTFGRECCYQRRLVKYSPLSLNFPKLIAPLS